MSLQDLRDEGVLLPESEWGGPSRKSTVPRWSIAILLATAVGALVAAYVGGGGWLTWVGIGAYLLDFTGIWWVLDRATLKQRRRVESDGN